MTRGDTAVCVDGAEIHFSHLTDSWSLTTEEIPLCKKFLGQRLYFHSHIPLIASLSDCGLLLHLANSKANYEVLNKKETDQESLMNEFHFLTSSILYLLKVYL